MNHKWHMLVVKLNAVLNRSAWSSSQMPFDGLNLDLDVKMTRGRVQDLRIYLHNRLKNVSTGFELLHVCLFDPYQPQIIVCDYFCHC